MSYINSKSAFALLMGLLFLLGSSHLSAQTYWINNQDVVTVNCTGLFYDAGGPNANFPNEDHQITFYPANPGNKVSVSFQYIELNNGRLSVYNGETTSENDVIAHLRDTATPATITSSSPDGALTFLFISKNYNNGARGWAAEIGCNVQDEDLIALASGSFSSCNARFYDSGGPDRNYLENNNTTISILPDQAGKKVSVSFDYIELAPTHVLEVYNGAEIDFQFFSNMIGNLRGSISQGTITSTADDGALTFRLLGIGSADPLRGWAATITCDPTPSDGIALASGTLEGCEGNFYDSGGPDENYIKGNITTTLLKPDQPGEKLSLDFSYVEVDYPNRVEVYNGNSMAREDMLARFEDNAGPGRITSSADDGSLTFHLYSPSGSAFQPRANNRGWAATRSCEVDNNADIRLYGAGNVARCAGKFYDSGGPAGNYYPRHKGRITISPPEPGKLVSVRFNQIDLAWGSRMRVFNGPTTDANQELIGFDDGVQSSRTYTSAAPDGSLTFEFESGNSAAGGWDADISCVDPPYFATAVEINQAVQPRIFDLSFPGNPVVIQNDINQRLNVPILPHKATLVRFYAAGTISPLTKASGKLYVNTLKNNQVQTAFNLEPNVEGLEYASDIPLLASNVQELHNAQLQQRVDFSRTINFVIPAELIPYDTERLVMVLVDGGEEKSSEIYLDLAEPVELGVNYRKITRKAWEIENEAIRDTLSGFLKSAYPVSNIRDEHLIVSTRVVVGNSSRPDSDFLYALIFQLINERAYASIAPFYFSGKYKSDYPIQSVYGGIVDDMAFLNNSGGYALVPKTPEQNSVLVNKVFVSLNNGRLVAHEIGHNLGLFHAGNAHGEGQGGRACINTTFDVNNGDENGTLFINPMNNMGSYDNRIADFGVALSKRTGGKWTAYPINPCPEMYLSGGQYICTGEVSEDSTNARVFDIMSYGTPAAFTTVAFNNSSQTGFHDFPFAKKNQSTKNWISSKNYKSIYLAIRDKKLPENNRVIQSNNPSGLLITGLLQDNSIDRVVVLQGAFSLDENDLSSANPNDIIEVELFNDQGALLARQMTLRAGLAESASYNALFSTFIPNVTSYQRIRVRNGNGITLYEQNVSQHRPSAELLNPIGGQKIEGDAYQLDFNGQDMDGDELSYMLSYSPDLGQNWFPLGFIGDTVVNKLDVDISWLPPSDSAIFKIASSDGLQSSTSITPQTFCLNTNGPCEPINVNLDSEGNVVTSRQDPLASLGFQVVPNPFRDELSISFDMTSGGKLEMELLDIIGQKVKSILPTKLVAAGSHNFQVSTEDLTPGLYLLQINSPLGSKSIKIIKE